mmetsp:Transcript_30596/g.49391  ORF Transcript_30596/g.49391 Transcript_30596/m.49391 type:complete len:239 (-) Transcript_30596:916-1632(-)
MRCPLLLDFGMPGGDTRVLQRLFVQVLFVLRKLLAHDVLLALRLHLLLLSGEDDPLCHAHLSLLPCRFQFGDALQLLLLPLFTHILLTVPLVLRNHWRHILVYFLCCLIQRLLRFLVLLHLAPPALRQLVTLFDNCAFASLLRVLPVLRGLVLHVCLNALDFVYRFLALKRDLLRLFIFGELVREVLLMLTVLDGLLLLMALEGLASLRLPLMQSIDYPTLLRPCCCHLLVVTLIVLL